MKNYFLLFAFALLGRFAAFADSSDGDIIDQQFHTGASMSFVCPQADAHPCFAEGNALGDSIEDKMGQAMSLKWNAVNANCGIRRLRGSQEQDERGLSCSWWCRYEPVLCDLYCGRRLDEGENHEPRALQDRATLTKSLKSFLDDYPNDISYTEDEEACMEDIECTMGWLIPDCNQ